MLELQGALLVATPLLREPPFHRTVVLVCQHDDDGALGVVLNRPSPERVVDYLPMWDEHLSPPAQVFFGGPVQPETALAVAAVPGAEEGDGWVPISGTLGLLDLGVPPSGWAADLAGLRVFSGYAGWVSGQLEGEVAGGDWFVVPALPGDSFTTEPDTLWRDVLQRLDDRRALYAMFPADPLLN